MAKIVLGMGTSHTPMLLASDETLPRFRRNRHEDQAPRQGGQPGELRRTAAEGRSATVRHGRRPTSSSSARTAPAPRRQRLRQVLASARLDALIVFGDDQNESYLEDCRPAFAVYYGDTIRNDNKQHETYSHLPEWYIKNRAAFFETEAPRDYPVHSGLALHLIESLMDAELRSRRLQVPARGRRRRPRGRLRAPSCDGFGAAGAGGADLPQHLFPADAAAAEALLSARPGDRPRGREVSGRGARRRAGVGRPEPLPGRRGFRPRRSSRPAPTRMRRSCRTCRATSCTPAARKSSTGSRSAGAIEHLHLDWFEYVPGYRTPAGTGTGMSFATWA